MQPVIGSTFEWIKVISSLVEKVRPLFVEDFTSKFSNFCNTMSGSNWIKTYQAFQDAETVTKNHKEKDGNRHIEPDILAIRKYLK